ncbi:endomucin-like isoform X2 [Pelobates fuscus]|uniref:endomucin-like isoform X2 n=1 Tax=Pelobates fuscus TaxID=191477 RepID=UPI002FE43E98
MKSLVAVVLFLSVFSLVSGTITTLKVITTSSISSGSSSDGTTTIPKIITTSSVSSGSSPDGIFTTASPSVSITLTQNTTEGNNQTKFEAETSTNPYSNTTADNITSPSTNKIITTLSKASNTSDETEISYASTSKTPSAAIQPTNVHPTLQQATKKTGIQLEENATKKSSINPKSNSNTQEQEDEKKPQTLNRKGLLIGVGCVVAVIVSVVLVFLCKICRKKLRAAENTGSKVSPQNKESVKLLSVKTSPADSDVKRMALPHQLDYIDEC